MTEIKKLQDENSEYQRELKLNKQYIRETEAKLQEANHKIKNLENKKSEEKSQKKQINIMRQSIAEDNKYLKQVENQFSFQKQ